MTDETMTELNRTDTHDGTGDGSGRDPQLDAAWARALAILEDTVTPQHRAFIGLSRLDGVVGETALLSVPHQFAKDVIEQRLRQVITSVLTEQIGHDVRVAVVVDPSLDGDRIPSGTGPSEPAGQGLPAVPAVGTDE
ncbi:MAG: hypothetical protein ACRDV2_03350, partial [Actinomycetes bacterium]